MNAFAEGLISIALAIVGLGVVATLVSKNAQTGSVLTAGFGGLATGIKAAEGPVLSGGGFSIPSSLGATFGG